MTKSEPLEDELREIDGLIETAAVDEDFVEWSRLAMRRDALPALIKREKVRPVRTEISRLEEVLAELETERKRVLEDEPTVPAEMRGYVTPSMVRNRLLGGITSRASAVGKELDGARGTLASIESEGDAPAEMI